MPKQVVILTIVMNCILLSAFVGGCVDFKAMQGIKNSNIKFAKMYVALADRVFLSHNFLLFTNLKFSRSYLPHETVKLGEWWKC